jgi:hypothetical protein
VTGETAYELLGLGPAASAALVEAAYRIRCAELAASSLSPTSVARPGRAVESAYAVLREPRRRAIYDLDLGRDPAADDAAPGGTLPRVRTCWRCGEVLDLAGRYCGVCHWVLCPACETCGCEHPNWRRRLPIRIVGWPARAVMTLLALVTAVVVSVRIVIGLGSGTIALRWGWPGWCAPNNGPGPTTLSRAPTEVLPSSPPPATPGPGRSVIEPMVDGFVGAARGLGRMADAPP